MDQKLARTATEPAVLARPAANQNMPMPARPLRLEHVPAAAPLAMPVQDLTGPRPQAGPRDRIGALRRGVLFAMTGLLTAGFAGELYGAISVEPTTELQIIFLVLCTSTFAWVALGSLSNLAGAFADRSATPVDAITLPPAERPLATRTALLFPVYNEDPAIVCGSVEALAYELAALGQAGNFDVFVLSDTRRPEARAAEDLAFPMLTSRLQGVIGVFHRRRAINSAQKAGNIAEWVTRFGAAYDHFIVFDADSVMTGAAVARLAGGLEAHPKAGLIQSVPRLIGARSVFARLQQFATAAYGPATGAGRAFWHRASGNYWGHNAILRTAAFAAAAGLPTLTGSAPFGGHIQSHDFVEAALLRRAGWDVHIVPSLEGSYEGCPQALIDLIIRDRRWCQGNLQHLRIAGARGLTGMGRTHLLMGACAYLTSLVWAASLGVGVLLSLQAQQLVPAYFKDEVTLFPLWPVIDAGAALRLFLLTMAIVLLPKLAGLAGLWRRTAGLQGRARVLAGVLTETVASMLLAPILMVTQSIAVIDVALGRDAGWMAQRRDGVVGLRETARFHTLHSVIGLMLLVLVAQVSYGLVAWMLPVTLGLMLAIPLSFATSRAAGPVLSWALATPEDLAPPAVVVRSDELRTHWSDWLAEARQATRAELAAAA